MTKCYLLYLS